MAKGKVDRRYTIRQEFCGHAKARWVVRFCGRPVEEATSRDEAHRLMSEHAADWGAAPTQASSRRVYH